MDLGLDGKVALVTGGSRGIGRACAERLAQGGLRRADRGADGGRSGGGRRRDPRRERPAGRDLRDRSALGAGLRGRRRRAEACVRPARHPGQQRRRHPERRLLQARRWVWEDGFALKFYSYVRLSRALWPLLKEAQGSVVNVIGGASKTPSANFMIGGAVNAAITNFTKALAELGLRDGVAVKAVHPGMTVTGRLETLLDQRAAAEGLSREAYEQRELARAGLRRYSQPEDIANLVAFLASPVAQQIHGADVFIDGGATKTIL